MPKITVGYAQKMPLQQADAYLNQVNPVSGTLYTVLPTTIDVRIISIASSITWAVTQPNPVDVVVTIDGIVCVFRSDNPPSGAWYYGRLYENNPMDNVQGLHPDTTAITRSFLLEGRSVKIETRVTWAVTQPTPLICRVKWARW